MDTIFLSPTYLPIWPCPYSLNMFLDTLTTKLVRRHWVHTLHGKPLAQTQRMINYIGNPIYVFFFISFFRKTYYVGINICYLIKQIGIIPHLTQKSKQYIHVNIKKSQDNERNPSKPNLGPTRAQPIPTQDLGQSQPMILHVLRHGREKKTRLNWRRRHAQMTSRCSDECECSLFLSNATAPTISLQCLNGPG